MASLSSLFSGAIGGGAGGALFGMPGIGALAGGALGFLGGRDADKAARMRTDAMRRAQERMEAGSAEALRYMAENRGYGEGYLNPFYNAGMTALNQYMLRLGLTPPAMPNIEEMQANRPTPYGADPNHMVSFAPDKYQHGSINPEWLAHAERYGLDVGIPQYRLDRMG